MSVGVPRLPGMRPSRRLVTLLGCWCLAALAIAAARIGWPQLAGAIGNLWWLAGVLLCGGALLDGFTGRRVRGLRGRRRVAGNLALGVENVALLQLRNQGPRPLAVDVCDHLPPQLETGDMPQRALLQPGAQAELRYTLIPRRRGRAAFGPIEALVDSPWGLWQQRVYLGVSQTVKVYPNFLGISSLQAMSTEQSLRHMGVHQLQRRGEGLDFRQLREYRQGDSQRQVDWRASARVRKLISREYQDERDQQIIYMLDCGRRMRAKDGDLSHFDHALNALLLSAYIAIKQGDAVGLHAFAHSDRGGDLPLPPVKGESAMNLLLNHVYDLHSGTASADFSGAAQRLLARQQRRALIILVTNLRDDNGDELLAAVQLLSRRHLVMVASLRETELDALCGRTVENFDDAVKFAATADFLARRAYLLQQLQSRNVILVDSEPARLHTALVAQYWQLKRSGVI
ncbi:DUF58 domain-containing protein [Microbulbifer sp. TYP-18]|uniref:DUF58 domain-containing protein n=1 Tax=Microbulbifer sp. TYP-18 TaxID=3230024 RepID=UPI0034C69E3A